MTFAVLPPMKLHRGSAAGPPGEYTFTYDGTVYWTSHTPGTEYADLNDDTLSTEVGVQWVTTGSFVVEWPAPVLLTSVYVRSGDSSGPGGWSTVRAECDIEVWNGSSWDHALYVTGTTDDYKTKYDFPANTVTTKCRLTATHNMPQFLAMSELQFV